MAGNAIRICLHAFIIVFVHRYNSVTSLPRTHALIVNLVLVLLLASELHSEWQEPGSSSPPDVGSRDILSLGEFQIICPLGLLTN